MRQDDSSKTLTDVHWDFELLKKWSLFRQFLENHFVNQGFLRLYSPLLVECPGTEPALDAFSVSLQNRRQCSTRFLPTSPELALKKALCAGASDIFEITSAFRNNEWTKNHLPQFTMLEWYRRDGTLNSIQEDLQLLLKNCCTHFHIPIPRVVSQSVASLFLEKLDFVMNPQHSISDLIAVQKRHNMNVLDSVVIDDHFFYLWLEKIEPFLDSDTFYIIHSYPAYQAGYARLNEQSGWAERLEALWRGRELANAFFEVCDATEQRARFESDNQKRQLQNKSVLPIDDGFLQAMATMPNCAGIALGVERLFMSLFQIDSILSLSPWWSIESQRGSVT